MAKFISLNKTFYNLDFVRKIEFSENTMEWKILLYMIDGEKITISSHDDPNLYLNLFGWAEKQGFEHDNP